eukprot:GHVT01079548.1.p1 GENE.GHVT01079548.1~~GHVT01079548.1.p1  ORF type:complete len:649 (+),score=131.20 GHVT01079548.1:382-2328(+)
MKSSAPIDSSAGRLSAKRGGLGLRVLAFVAAVVGIHSCLLLQCRAAPLQAKTNSVALAAHQAATCKCPDRFFFHKGQCVQVQTRSSIAACPYFPVAGHGASCLRQVAQWNRCAETYAYVEGLGCVREEYLPREPSCPRDLTLTGDKCEGTLRFPRQSRCDSGDLMDGKCRQVLQASPKVSACPPGAVRHGDVCVSATEGHSALVCEPGATLDGLACRTTLYAPKIYACPEGSTLRDSGGADWRAKLPQRQRELVAQGRLCPVTVAAPCLQQAREEPHRRLGAIKKREKTGVAFAAGRRRHLGAVRSARQRHAVAATPMQTHPDRSISMLCTTTKFVPGKGHCPAGYLPLRQTAEMPSHELAVHTATPSDCYKVVFAKPKLKCLDYLVENGGTECMAPIKIPTIRYCGSQVRVDGLCQQWISQMPTFFCPEGTVENQDMCEAPTIVEPQFKCPPGFHIVGDMCYRKQFENPMVCLDNHVQIGNQCYVNEKPITKCPKGFEPSTRLHNKCVSFVAAPLECHGPRRSPVAGHDDSFAAHAGIAPILLDASANDAGGRDFNYREHEEAGREEPEEYRRAFESHALALADDQIVDVDTDESGVLGPSAYEEEDDVGPQWHTRQQGEAAVDDFFQGQEEHFHPNALVYDADDMP